MAHNSLFRMRFTLAAPIVVILNTLDRLDFQSTKLSTQLTQVKSTELPKTRTGRDLTFLENGQLTEEWSVLASLFHEPYKKDLNIANFK